MGLQNYLFYLGLFKLQTCFYIFYLFDNNQIIRMEIALSGVLKVFVHYFRNTLSPGQTVLFA